MSNLVKITSPEHLTAIIKAIVPRSFEKTFGELSTHEIVAGFMFCTSGLSQNELNAGLQKITQMGYCPDPAMFAKWCKGLEGFDNTDAIADSYVGKAAALENIEKWLASDGKTQITVAEKTAYDASYRAWQNMASQADKTHARQAFKDFYEAQVAKLVAERKPCEIYIPPIAIARPSQAQTVNHEQAMAEMQRKIARGLHGRA
ncbi:hypothetical protein B0181_09230 [Moraxella caviae]|uniref:Uncharacterized protein n=1 Tax=Moraxella caviae TaxID=34060 RepID=A0A1S9ZYE7_9GAMM|nr:hypothetical protein [Moraxella caviae]OOR88001.1 hypothetical protein B0181_09230 [Moraxella caviae]STZ14023.1 Uncharacterised protein [Moraxella caviae]STZ14495.1 Uncharacterised protein [Moraxella caviae]VEW11325.1 Uncharacterised protein [Moraxella caviae]VEW12841.1 Uncharacterised protein [Moraxella caviae]